jgi:hypothetical protein
MSAVFHPNRTPTITPGNYSMTAKLTLTASGASIAFPETGPANINRSFKVSGRHLTLDASMIAGMFPPPGSIGDHSNVLPHITLASPTLPWERSVAKRNTPVSTVPISWLALLLFDETENAPTRVLNAAQLSGIPFTFTTVETEEQSDQVTLLEISDTNLITAIVPTRSELATLAHIRETTSGAVAEIVCKRLPATAHRSTMHLVSMEGRYNGETFVVDGIPVRFISLASWSFTCREVYHVSDGALAQLGNTFTADQINQLRDIGSIEGQSNLITAVQTRLNTTLPRLAQQTLVRVAQAETFHGLLLNLNRTPAQLRMPSVANASAEHVLSWGSVPLPHKFRNGLNGISWYHGPLSTGSMHTQPVHAQPILPANSSDKLARYYTEFGMFDVSYSAAWELGRLLAIRNARFAFDLYNWRRAKIRGARVASQIRQASNLDVFDAPRATAAAIPLPETVTDFLTKLGNLEELPFNYLVPAEGLLPAESIRFFTIDRSWMRCLLDGAFSVGRAALDFHLSDAGVNLDTFLSPVISGFLLRSDLVSGWPATRINAISTGIAGPVQLTPRRLGTNVLCAFMTSAAAQVEFALNEENLHFAFEPGPAGGLLLGSIAVPLSTDNRRVLNMTQLLASMANVQDSADFAARTLAQPITVRIGTPANAAAAAGG